MQQRSEETRKAIINAAEILFTQQGYSESGVAGICKMAGVSKGAFYHHFASKQAVFMELMDTRLSSINEAMQRVLEEQRDVPDALMYLASLGKLLFLEGEKQLNILMEYWEQTRHDPDAWKTAGEPYARYQSFMSRIIQKGIDEGSLRQVDPDDVSRLIIAVATGLMLQGVMDTGGNAWGQTIEKYIELVLEGIRR